MKIDISENLGAITVSVEIPARTLGRDPIVECNYRIVKQLLLEEGYENLVPADNRGLVISNTDNNNRLKGVWKFTQKVSTIETKPLPPKSSSRKKRATKSKSTSSQQD